MNRGEKCVDSGFGTGKNHVIVAEKNSYWTITVARIGAPFGMVRSHDDIEISQAK